MSTQPKMNNRKRLIAAALALLVFSTEMAMGQQVEKDSNLIPNELLVKFVPNIPTAQAQNTIQGTGAEIVGNPTLDGRLFHVRVSDPSRLATIVKTLKTAPGVEYVEPVSRVSIPPMPK